MSSSDLRETALPRARSSPCVGLWFLSPLISPGVRGLHCSQGARFSWARLTPSSCSSAVLRGGLPAAARGW